MNDSGGVKPGLSWPLSFTLAMSLKFVFFSVFTHRFTTVSKRNTSETFNSLYYCRHKPHIEHSVINWVGVNFNEYYHKIVCPIPGAL